MQAQTLRGQTKRAPRVELSIPNNRFKKLFFMDSIPIYLINRVHLKNISHIIVKVKLRWLTKECRQVKALKAVKATTASKVK